MADTYNLDRFVEAQAATYAQALAELRAGGKRTHWMWFMFPQLAGLGTSAMAQQYALASRDEAHAYLAHGLLGARLRDLTHAVLLHRGTPLAGIFGYPDDLKFCSSMTLFAEAAEDGEALFAQAIAAFCGAPDTRTLQLLH